MESPHIKPNVLSLRKIDEREGRYLFLIFKKLEVGFFELAKLKNWESFGQLIDLADPVYLMVFVRVFFYSHPSVVEQFLPLYEGFRRTDQSLDGRVVRG